MDTRLPEGFVAETGNATSSGNQIHVHGLTTGQGLLIAAIACFAFGMAITDAISDSRNYRELEREVRLQQLKLDEYRVALMNAGIDPNPHAKGESQ